MKISRRIFLSVVAMVMASSFALSANAFTEGREYMRISPKTTGAADGKIAVLEFFSYGCPHCMTLSAAISAWEKKLPADVELIRVPVSWGRDSWASLARAFYTLNLMGLHELSDKAFGALQRQRINISDEKIFMKWLEQNGVDVTKAENMYRSFAVNNKLRQSGMLENEYRVQDVPHIYVNGNIELNFGAFRTEEEFLKGIDQAIDMARKENASKKK
jgi:thiol:disulfide interchange protein DsbA